jgi:hypothetical protein
MLADNSTVRRVTIELLRANRASGVTLTRVVPRREPHVDLGLERTVPR